MQNLAIASADFWEKFWLLILTAVLTGLIVPLVKLVMDYMKDRRQKEFDADLAKRQKEFEADLARQGKIIEEQISLSDELTRLVWEYQFLCLKVSYYKAMTDDEAGYKAACAEFDARSWLLLGQIRIEISKAKRLTSPATYKKLNDFYGWLNGVDTELSSLTLEKSGHHSHDGKRKKYAPTYSELGDEKWEAFHKTLFFGGGTKIDEMLALVARDTGLASAASVSGGGAEAGGAEEPEPRFLEMIEQVVGARGTGRTRLPESPPPASGVTAGKAAGGGGATRRVAPERG